jgi:hypothetical protein
MVFGGGLQFFYPSCHVAVPGDALSGCQLLHLQEEREIVAAWCEKHANLFPEALLRTLSCEVFFGRYEHISRRCRGFPAC